MLLMGHVIPVMYASLGPLHHNPQMEYLVWSALKAPIAQRAPV